VADALVVYESMFGNTQQVAQAVAEGMAGFLSVEVVEVGAAPAGLPGETALLVVGAPTHAFGMSRPNTRQDAARQGAPDALVSPTIGVREWLAELEPAAQSRTAAAAFDTRIRVPLPGSAARAIRRRLRNLGFTLAGPARTFSVKGTRGPLADGELDAARVWGRALASSFVDLGQPSQGRP